MVEVAKSVYEPSVKLLMTRPEIARSATFRAECMTGLFNLMDNGEKLCATKKLIVDTLTDHMIRK